MRQKAASSGSEDSDPWKEWTWKLPHPETGYLALTKMGVCFGVRWGFVVDSWGLLHESAVNITADPDAGPNLQGTRTGMKNN